MTAIQADSARPNTSYAIVREGARVDRRLARYLSLDDFEESARRRLPRMLYGFISGGAARLEERRELSTPERLKTAGEPGR